MFIMDSLFNLEPVGSLPEGSTVQTSNRIRLQTSESVGNSHNY